MNNSLKSLRANAKAEYSSIGCVFCPYFQEEIVFNSEGFKHIRYRSKYKERHFKVQKIRYHLLGFAPKLLKTTSTLQEYELRVKKVKVKINKQKSYILKKVQYFGFIGIIEGCKVKVVVRQLGNGKKHFWSVIPNWKTRSTKDNKKTFQNHSGDLAKD